MVYFFKQKTAYEIKECDWSSDMCSSDLDLSELPTLKDFQEVGDVEPLKEPEQKETLTETQNEPQNTSDQLEIESH